MRKIFETIKELILLFLLIGFGSALIDYARICAGSNPLFCVKKFNNITKVETFQGLFYSGSRKISDSQDEKFMLSSDISYKFLTLNVSVPKQFRNTIYKYHLTPHKSDNCSNSYLYYADSNTKLYLYCIDSIDYLEKTNDSIPFSKALRNNPVLIEDFIVKNKFVGTRDRILEFKSDEEVISPNVVIYRCHNKDINDIYIVPEGEGIQDDFCNYKDDDKDFIWKVVDENKSFSDSLEIIYEDDDYQYELSDGNKDNIYIVYPATRGREEEKVKLMDIINDHKYSMDELIDRGLNITKVVKKES